VALGQLRVLVGSLARPLQLFAIDLPCKRAPVRPLLPPCDSAGK